MKDKYYIHNYIALCCAILLGQLMNELLISWCTDLTQHGQLSKLFHEHVVSDMDLHLILQVFYFQFI